MKLSVCIHLLPGSEALCYPRITDKYLRDVDRDFTLAGARRNSRELRVFVCVCVCVCQIRADLLDSVRTLWEVRLFLMRLVAIRKENHVSSSLLLQPLITSCDLTAFWRGKPIPPLWRPSVQFNCTDFVNEVPQCSLKRQRHSINPLTGNDHYSGRTASLTSKRCILYIYSTNIGTEYFKHGIYSPFFSLQNEVCFIILTYLVPVLFTFYIQSVLKLKKNIPTPKPFDA